MFKFARLLIFNFILSAAYLMADPTLPGVVAATEGDPGSIAAGCVNVITGDLVIGKEDLSVRGAVSLPLHRSYASGNGKAEDCNCGWHFFFPHFRLKCEVLGPYEPETVELTLPSGTGVQFHYSGKEKKNRVLEPVITRHAVGMTNNSSGILSGRTNFKNARILFDDGKHGKSNVRLVTPEGLHCYYEPFKVKKEGRQEFVLVREELPNGCWILYEHDKYGRPTLAKVVNPNQNKVFSWALFYWEGSEKESHNVRIETSDQRELCYTFERRRGKEEEKSDRFYLREINGSFTAGETITFAPPPKGFNSLLTEMKSGSQLVQKILYHYPEKKGEVKDKHDHRCNRVKELFRPAGPNGEEICTHRFSYPKIHWREDMSCCEKGGITTVEGPHGLKTTYEWSRELRPLWMRLYDTEDSSQPKMMHELVWGAEKTNEVGDLKARALLDGDGRYIWIKTYSYDDHFNPITETFHGNLTGTCQGHFGMNDRKIEGGETYSHRYKYSNDGRNLLLEDREDNGRIIRYQYFPGTALLSAKLTCGGQRIWHRELYEYDEDHLLSAEIIDDGISSDPKDFSGITHRVAKRTYRRSDGLPDKIEERCYDPSTGQEKVLKTIFMHYSPKLLLSRQEIFDSEDNHTYTLFFEYDDKDRLIRETDPLGHSTSYVYDHLGRPILSENPNGNVDKVIYDAGGRPTVFTETSPEGKVHTHRMSYNALGHKIASIDPQGYATKFSPDPWGRNKRIEYPDGSQEKVTYNAMGCPIRQVNRAGAITTINYNAYGKPISIRHPDGSEESFVYDRAGNLIRSTNRHGTSILFFYDLLGRITRQEAVDRKNQKLRDEHFHYSGPRLIQHINPEGESTEFEYDAVGRKIAEHKHGTTTRFRYDAVGRLCATASEEATHETTYDALGRIISEKTVSSTGELHQESTYVYDCDGHVVHKAISTLQGPSIEQSTYDTFGRQTSQTNPLGYKTMVQWDESSSGIVRKITTDPVGTQTIETIGALGRVIAKEILSPQNKRLALTSYVYDAEGHCIEEQTQLKTRTIVTKRTYVLGKLATLTEAAGTPEQKTTRYAYDQDLLRTVYKNDGVEMHYTYDALGRIASCTANTGEGYSYAYDQLDRVTSVTDLSRGLISTRSYDASGAVIEEVFLHGLSISYIRDPLGKPLSLILPDQTGIGYRWEASRLKEVFRLDEEGRVRYAHTYDQYDLTGCPISSSLIAGLGAETRLYDLAHRPSERSTAFHHQVARKRNPLGSLLEAQSRFIDFTDDANYSYDSLQQLQKENSLFHSHSFSFDAHGTPLLRDEKQCQTNSLYQLEGVGELLCTYTPAGNLDTDGRFNYRYDAFDRLIEIEEPNVQKAQYFYDSWHRRMQKALYLWQGGEWVLATTRSYLYDGMHEIGSTNESGNIVDLRLLGHTTHAESGATIAIECSGRLYAPLHDLRGNITGLIDASTRQLVEIYRYSAFGDVKIYDAHNNPTHSITNNPWRFFGKRTDEETGLILFGRRYYHTQLGKWITPDPAQTIDHPNLYLFLRANPLNLHDALGLAADPNTFYMPDRPNHYEPTPLGLALNHGISTAVRPLGYGLYYGAYELPVPYIRDGIMHVGSFLARNKRCVVEYSKMYYLPGNGKRGLSDYVLGNGVHTTKEEALRRGQEHSDMLGGQPVWVFHNASKGLILDLVDCGLELCGVATDAVKVGLEGRKQIYDEAKQNSGGKEPSLIVNTHSEGCIIERVINTTLQETNPEIPAHTTLYALGSPITFSNKVVGGLDVRISKWDIVGMFDVIGRLKGRDHVNIVDPIGSFPLCDHAFEGRTYRKEINNIIYDIKTRNGL